MSDLSEEEKTRVAEWVEDWQAVFDSSYTPEDLEGWVGKKVRLSRGEAESADFNVVGHTVIVIAHNGESATQLGIVSHSGMMIHLRKGMTVEVIED